MQSKWRIWVKPFPYFTPDAHISLSFLFTWVVNHYAIEKHWKNMTVYRYIKLYFLTSAGMNEESGTNLFSLWAIMHVYRVLLKTLDAKSLCSFKLDDCLGSLGPMLSLTSDEVHFWSKDFGNRRYTYWIKRSEVDLVVTFRGQYAMELNIWLTPNGHGMWGDA